MQLILDTRGISRANADKILEQLSSMERDELARMLAQLIQVYVVDGVQPFHSGGAEVAGRSAAEEESFAAMIARLKKVSAMPELEKFVVDGEMVSIRTNDQIIPITEYRTAAERRREQEQSREQPGGRGDAPPERRESDQPPAAAPKPKEPPKPAGPPARMIELD